MHIGDFLDVLVFIVLGIVMLNVRKKNKEKLGNKEKWVLYGGIAFILLAVLRVIAIILK